MQHRGILGRLIQGLLKREIQDTHAEMRQWRWGPCVRLSEPETCQWYCYDHTEINSSVCFGDSEANVQRCVSAVTLLMLGSGVATGGVSKTAGSSSSVENGGGCRVGLGGPQDVVGASGAGWCFTSEFLDAGSRAVGDRARLACRGGMGDPEAWGICLSGTFCSSQCQHKYNQAERCFKK